MKWLFLVNDAAFLFEFLGKIAGQLIKEGDECLVVLSSRMAEYERLEFFPKESAVLSKVDWCIKNGYSTKEDKERKQALELLNKYPDLVGLAAGLSKEEAKKVIV